MDTDVSRENWIANGFEVLSQDGERTVLRGGLPSAARPEVPVLALLARQGATHHAFERILREFRIREHLDAHWAAQPLELREEDHALLLRDPGGELLANLGGRPMAVEPFLELGIAIAEAVDRMHRSGLLHQDIRPENLLYDRGRNTVRLLGFGCAARVAQERRDPGEPDNAEEIASGALPYIAPERTGRMNRTVDARSDLYSVGVTLYELLTGQLPFHASDPVEWMHCHVARRPVAAAERRGDVPAQLSRVIMTLLEKAAENRHASASSLRSDLAKCQRQWRASRSIREFTPGAAGAVATLQFRRGLYGRDAELQTLRSAIDGVVTTGERRLVLIGGYSGTGKSSLIAEVLPEAARLNCLVARGKFDQYQRDVPYGTLAHAFRGLVRDLLGTPDEELARWRESMSTALGCNGQLVIDLVPEVGHLVGEAPSVPELSGTEARNRFLRVWRDFVGVFAQPDHPLVIVLDDLQWLDAATLDVFISLATHPAVRCLVLVGAFRSNEVAEAARLANILQALRQASPGPLEIELGGIGLHNAAQMIADAMQASAAEVAELTSCVVGKSGDNPFFMVQFLGSLADHGLLAHDAAAARWRWDMKRIAMQEATGSIVDLMVHRLGRLPAASLRAVQVIACMGSRIDCMKLRVALDADDHEVRMRLGDVLRLGLLLELEDGYGFAHDRVHEAAYAMLSSDVRDELHRAIGFRLLSRSTQEELDAQLFDIAGQFNRSSPARLAPQDRVLVASLNLRAARKARRSSAYSEACNYLQAGLQTLAEQDRAAQRDLLFELTLELAECTFLRGDLPASRSMIDHLLGMAATTLERACAYRLKVELHVVNSENEEAVQSSITALDSLGVQLIPRPAEPDVQAAYDQVWRQISQRPFEELADLPPMTDPHQLAAMRLLAETWPPAYFTNFNLTVTVICKMVELSLAHGSSAKSNQGFALLGWLMGPVSGRYQDGYRLARLATDLALKGDSTLDAGRTCDTMALMSAWTQPLDESIQWARQAFAKLREAGDIYFACYSLFHATLGLFMRGHGLRDESEELRRHLAFASEIGFQDGQALIATYERTVACLRGETHGLADFSDDAFDGAAFEAGLVAPRMYVVIQCYWTMKTLLHYLDGDPQAALSASERFYTGPDTQIHHIRHLDWHFYTGLTVAALIDTASADHKSALRARLTEHHRVITQWAQQTRSATFTDKQLLLGAEAARVDGLHLEAEQLYERSARAARENGFKPSEAIACELAARFYRKRGLDRVADAYLRDAVESYGRWGARGKVQQLLRTQPSLARPPYASAGVVAAPALDVASVLRRSQPVASGMAVDQLVTTLMRTVLEQAGAQRAVFLLVRRERLEVAAVAATVGESLEVRLAPAAAPGVEAPESILRFVTRTRECVLLDDALADSRFAHDADVVRRRIRSVLCLPVIDHAKLQAILYVENSLAPRVFTQSHLEVLTLLSVQATMSLDNARLYADLQAREAKIRRIFDLNVIGIVFWDLSGQLLDANDAFLRMVGHDRDELESGSLRWYDMTPPEWQAQVPREVQELAETGALKPLEKEFYRKDGMRVPVLMGAATFEGIPGEGVAVIVDLSKQKEAERRAIDVERSNRALHAELAHANRVATMGHLAAWIAHDVKQPLAGIVTSGDAALRWLSADPPNIPAAQRAINRAVGDGMRAAEILDRTRALVERATPQAETIDINWVVRDTLALVAPEALRQGISLRRELGAGQLLVMADRVQIQQVVLNLLVNAMDALGTDARAQDPVVRVISGREPEGCVVVAVEDNGPGLPIAGGEACFQAFYTTKPDGLGMGLAICRSIVESFGGRISAEANEPRGARVQFTLPVESAAETMPSPGPA